MRDAEFRALIRDVPDFPEPGIVYKDITPLLASPQALAAAMSALSEPFRERGVTKVVGIEARGFIFAAPIAYQLGAGFIPIRKAGKLPHHIHHQEYDLEYGTDRIEVHSDAAGPEDRVLIVDDVLATGGTGVASVRLIEGLGAEVIGFAVLLELGFLAGRERLAGTDIHAVCAMGPTDVASVGREPDAIIESVVAEYRRHPHPDPDGAVATLRAAYEMAATAHAGQMRQTGDSYITHPLIVAEILARFGQDRDTIVAAVLHDVVEDTAITLDMIEKEFGATTAGLIDGVTKLDRVKFSSKKQRQAATIRKMAIAIAKNRRVLLIKLVDRLHNIRTLDPLPPDKQRRVATETLEIYAPLAHRFGVQEIKHEMEDRCFALLHPKRMAELDELLRRRSPERDAIIEKVQKEVVTLLCDAGIEAEVTGRPEAHLFDLPQDGGIRPRLRRHS